MKRRRRTAVVLCIIAESIFPLRPIDVGIIVCNKIVQLFLGYSRVLCQQTFVGAKVIGLSAHPALIHQLVAMVAFAEEGYITITDYPIKIACHRQMLNQMKC